ncbi:hypothetical protein [Pontibacter sp. SGAir0037]|uniref:hypothetical protein n=1 Tax=Pontibacter sp. SGAir0037 TaxID=2571030 RepID=UPI0010CD148A|nr:hypothetical protein [Pontibacter sp. SGAir0037]QCR21371.1 hypothetical protein C1N53_02745 [Pontibacter sp. SGAir0037]
MKYKIILFAFRTFAAACNPIHESKTASLDQEDRAAQTVQPPVEQEVKDRAYTLDSELENLTLGKFNTSGVTKDSTNEYGAGDCFGKVTYYSQKSMGLGIDSMSCGEYGYTYTHYLLDSKKTIQAVYLKKSESLLQPDGNWKYALTERIFDFRNSQATIIERVDTLNDYNKNVIAKDFEVKKLNDRQTALKKWTTDFKELWELEESY